MDLELVLVRHGETTHNKASIIQGHLDIGLSEMGAQQARLVGCRLANETWHQVWSSDLVRARRTAEIILEQHCINNGQEKLEIKLDERIRERYYGTAQGRPLSDLKELANRAGTSVSAFTPPEAETPEELQARAVDFFNDLCRQTLESGGSKARVLVVSHGGWLRMLADHLTSAGGRRGAGGHGVCPNTGVSSFLVRLDATQRRPTDIRCHYLYDRSHLADGDCGGAIDHTGDQTAL